MANEVAFNQFMNQTLDDTLIEAISAYDYPPITYDFPEGRQRRFSSMIDLDHFLQTLLLSGDVGSMKDGLSGILYWGHYRAGFRDHRVMKFRTTVSDVELRSANEAVRLLDGTGARKPPANSSAAIQQYGVHHKASDIPRPGTLLCARQQDCDTNAARHSPQAPADLYPDQRTQ